MKSHIYNKIYFEYLLAPHDGRRKTLIILPGVPSKPKNHEIFEKFCHEGFDVFYPRYEGTWESHGEFLERNPVASINEFIDALVSGVVVLDGNEYLTKGIFLLGSSFGGMIALTIEDRAEIKKICAMSPVVSFKRVSGIDTLEDYLQKTMLNSYRFGHHNWMRLINDEIVSLEKLLIYPHKVFVLAGEYDDQIKIKDIRFFVEINGIENFKIEASGHLTLSKISESILNSILIFFK